MFSGAKCSSPLSPPGSRSARPAGGRTPRHTGREEWMQADLATGQGMDEAVRGCDAIVHAASDPRHADAVDVNGTRRLTGGRRPRLRPAPIIVSIVGVDQVPVSDDKRKLAAEQIVGRAGVPFSILRATQFHLFLDRADRRAGGSGAARPAGSPRGVRHPACRGVRGRRTADAVHRRWTARPGHRLRRTRSALVPRCGGAVATGAAHEEAHRAHSLSVESPARALRAGKGTAPQGDRGAITWGKWLTGTRDT